MATDTAPKVLLVISHIALGGAESVAVTLAEGAADKVNFLLFSVMDYEQRTDVGEALKSRLNEAKVPIATGTRLSFKKGGFLLAAFKLRNLILREQPDIIHVHTEMPELTLAIAISTIPIARRPHVLRSVHNTMLWSGWQSIGYWVTRRLLRASIAGVSKAALAADLRLRIDAGLPISSPEYSELIYNGVANPSRVKEPRESESPTGSLDSTPKRLLFAGRFEYQKGVDLLPEILSTAARYTKAQAEVTFIGDGSLRKKVEDDIHSASIRWPVIFRDAIPNLAEILPDYDLIIMPSRFEGLGLVAIEARLAGVPVVAFAAPGLLEVIPESDPFSISIDSIKEFSAAISNYLDDPYLFDKLAFESISNYAERFSIPTMIDKYVCLYNKIIGKRSNA